MGMYTELHYNVELKKDTPVEVIEILKIMVSETDIGNEDTKVPKHKLFKKGGLDSFLYGNTRRWRDMLQCDSYYFSADTHSTLRYDDIGKTHYLCIRTNFKNYANEIKLFIDWIELYVYAEPGEFLGFYRYEEENEPTLIYLKGEYGE